MSEAEETYEVERIIDHRPGPSGCDEYLIRWKNYTSDEDSWEPANNLHGCHVLLKEFWKNKQKAVPSTSKHIDRSNSNKSKSKERNRGKSHQSSRTKSRLAAKPLIFDDSPEEGEVHDEEDIRQHKKSRKSASSKRQSHKSQHKNTTNANERQNSKPETSVLAKQQSLLPDLIDEEDIDDDGAAMAIVEEDHLTSSLAKRIVNECVAADSAAASPMEIEELPVTTNTETLNVIPSSSNVVEPTNMESETENSAHDVPAPIEIVPAGSDVIATEEQMSSSPPPPANDPENVSADHNTMSSLLLAESLISTAEPPAPVPTQEFMDTDAPLSLAVPPVATSDVLPATILDESPNKVLPPISPLSLPSSDAPPKVPPPVPAPTLRSLLRPESRIALHNSSDEFSQLMTKLKVVNNVQDSINASLKMRENDTVKASFSTLNLAVQKGNVVIVDRILRAPFTENIDAGDETLLMKAAKLGFSDVAYLLIKAGADVNKLTNEGDNALMFAAAQGFVSTCFLLINSGSHINHVNQKRETALTKAVGKGHKNIVVLLLQYGVNVHALSSVEGKSALAVAERLKLDEIQDLLRKSADKINSHLRYLALYCLQGFIKAPASPGPAALSSSMNPFFPIQMLALLEAEEFTIRFHCSVPAVVSSETNILLLANALFQEEEMYAALGGTCLVKSAILNGVEQIALCPPKLFITSFSPLKMGENVLTIQTQTLTKLLNGRLIVGAFRVKINM